MQKEFSFADQIRAAKNKRMELTMEASSSVHAANKKPGEGCVMDANSTIEPPRFCKLNMEGRKP
ncbi:uncharacterized protein Pyn_30693 [Prunus yedoensis var. nudiflora]|uniref:Uncharacterized protein n=1 Tax=Prunus yedoensis var. nudiflora TaxID=2094558 RepID=A0A314Y053_PRUYE|nr:uncharacterized protein Pyn_30693 [Prunus yedoensis var. nudiflora]